MKIENIVITSVLSELIDIDKKLDIRLNFHRNAAELLNNQGNELQSSYHNVIAIELSDFKKLITTKLVKIAKQFSPILN